MLGRLLACILYLSDTLASASALALANLIYGQFM